MNKTKMKKFHVTVSILRSEVHEVFAEDETQAEELVLDGEGNEMPGRSENYEFEVIDSQEII